MFVWLIMKVIFWNFWDKKSEQYLSELYYRALISNWRFFEAKFLARLCCYLKRNCQTWLQFIYLVYEEGAGSLDPKIDVLLLGLYVLPSNNHFN